MIGQTLGSYLIEAELGSGAMGIVYRGRNIKKDGKPAAIKTIHKEALARGGKAFDRFIREIDLLEQFRHPNIVRYLARGRYQGIYYFAMEYIAGSTLDAIIKTKGPLDWKDVVRYGIQLCSALDYAHERSVIHRDLKPSNLMISEQGQLKLTDFGIAKDLDATALTAAGRTLGTAAYMAPEQITGTPEVSHKTDLYALGVVMYEMLTGETPFHGETVAVLMHRHMTQTPPRPSSKTAIIPVALDDLVVKLMSKSPADRPWDAAAVALALQELVDKETQGRKIAMVWPEEGSPSSMPTRAFSIPDQSSRIIGDTQLKKKKKSKTSAASTSLSSEGASQLVGLVAALILVGGLIGYLVWPPSEKYLYAKAETLMQSPERTDWLLAEEQYIKPLEARFPNHHYRSQTDSWQDKIALSSAINRADYIKKPQTTGEEFFLATAAESKAASEKGDDLEAVRLWKEMAEKLDKKGRPERGWTLLARQKADDLDKAIKARQATLRNDLQRADEFEAKGNVEIAVNLRRKAVDRYASFTDVADLVNEAKAKIPANTKSPSDPSPVPPDDQN